LERGWAAIVNLLMKKERMSQSKARRRRRRRRRKIKKDRQGFGCTHPWEKSQFGLGNFD